MTIVSDRLSATHALLALLASAVLAACGGGGQAASPNAPLGLPPVVSPAPTPSGEPTDIASWPSNAAAVANLQAPSAAASVVLAGVADGPIAAPSSATGATGRTFYVDNAVGDDGNDGRSATAEPGGRGPWRTLARVMGSDLGPGDALLLSCGGTWHETLRLPASGTAAQPLRVGAATPGCVAPPVIDGSVALPASLWTLYEGNVYKAPLDAAPLLVTSATAIVWSEAHHPNRGDVAADPSSPYLSTAADSDIVTVNGQAGSTSLYNGADLIVPAGVQLAAGARIAIRINAWWLEEHQVTAVTGNRITFDTPTWFPVEAGRGYYLVGQLWMADSAGEWYYDVTAHELYAYMPDKSTPTALRVATLATGIDLQGRSFVVVDGVAVRRVGTGADLRDSNAITLRNGSFTDIAGVGADLTGSAQATVEFSAFSRTGLDAISGWQLLRSAATGMVVRNNVIRDSSVQMDGDKVLSLPRFSNAAIYGGTTSTISGNVVVNSGYIGIQAQANSLIERNFVYGACSVLDDCGGIYTQYADNNSVIRGNTIVHSRGAIAGKPPSEAFTSAQGIYLDESVTGVLIQDNTVVDTDNGIQLHVSSHNTISDNRLYANRRTQIWLQANRNVDNPGGDLSDNSVVDNLIAPVSPDAVGIWLDTIYASTAGFGTIDRNRYFDRVAPVAVMVRTAAGFSNYSFAQWQGDSSGNLPAGHDGQGTATSTSAYAWYRISGASLVGSLAPGAGLGGWSSWNATAPLGTLTHDACPAGECLHYVAGASQGLVSSPNFSVRAGQWYRLSIDLAAGSDGQPVTVVVRRGGGGGNGYESLSDGDLALTLGRGWQRYTRVFQVTETVNAGDPVTGDNGARIDITPVLPGQSVLIANAELVPVTPEATSQVSAALVNVGSSAKSWDCPFNASQPTLCAKFRRLSDDAPLAWPASVPAYAAELVYAQEPTLQDSDGDGIADVQDACPGTARGKAVNAAGCPLTLP